MRVGAAQDLIVSGLGVLPIMQAGGWKTMNVVGRYVENANLAPLLRRAREVGATWSRTADNLRRLTANADFICVTPKIRQEFSSSQAWNINTLQSLVDQSYRPLKCCRHASRIGAG